MIHFRTESSEKRRGDDEISDGLRKKLVEAVKAYIKEKEG
jgi:hypothetical protein